MADDLGSLAVSFTADLSGLTSGAQAAKDQIASVGDAPQAASPGFLSGIGGMVGGLVNFGSQIGMTVIGMQGLAQGAMGLAGALLGPAATAETTQLSFETLLHSTSKAHQEMVDLNTYAASTPMQTQWVDNAAAKILAFGGKTQDVIPEITAIGDSLSGLGKLSEPSLNSIVDIFGKISAQGKLTGGDMMQLSTWGIPAWQALSETMHEPISVLQKMVSSGAIPAKTAIADLEQGMEKAFGGGMQKQANTFTGLLSTLQSNAQIAMAAIGGPALKLAEQGLTALGNVLSSSAFQSFATNVGQQIANVLSQIGGFVSSTVVPGFQQLGPIIGQVGAYFQGADFQGFLADVQTLGNQIQQVLIGAFHALAPYIPSFQQALHTLGGVLTGTVIPALDNLIFPLGQFLMWMQQAGPWQETIKAGLIGVGVAFAAIQIGAFIATIPALVAGFIAWAAGAWAAAAGTIAATWPIFAIGAAIAIVVAIIILAVKNWGAIAHWLQGLWAGIASFFIDDIIHPIGNAFSAFGSFMHGLWDGIVGVFKGAINGIITGINDFIGFIDSLQIHIPSIGVGPIHTPAFDWNGLGIPRIPLLATGGLIPSGGMGIAGEAGPELIFGGSSGSRVLSAAQTQALLGGSQEVHVHVYLDGQEMTNQIGNNIVNMIRATGPVGMVA